MQNGKPFSLRQRIVWSTIVAILIAVLALGVFNAVTLPGCSSCHVHGDFRTATASSPHATVDCRSCHVPPGTLGRIAFSLGQPLHMFVPFAGGSSRDSAAVPDSRCLPCHEDIGTAVTSSNGIRISHQSCAAGASCSDCHSETAHGTATRWVRVYEMDSCLACHISTGKTDCDLCHEGRDPGNRVDSPTFAVTHGAEWRSTHGMGDGATCTVCHKTDDCAGCHGAGVPHGPDFVEKHAEVAAGDGAKCEGCHASSFCDGCHGTPMPHTRKFIAGHAKMTQAQRAGCRRCHADSDCTTCHAKHVHPGGAVGGAAPVGGGGR